MKDKILFNALQFSPDGGGISKYSAKLLEYYLKNYKDVDVLVRNDELKNCKSKNIINCKRNISNSLQRTLEEQIFLIKLLNKYSLIHYSGYVPIFANKPCIVTVHDLNRCALPQMWTKTQNLNFRILMNATIFKAKKIICISKFTANELIKYYKNIDTDKIEVILLGFDISICKNIHTNFQYIKNKYAINKEYMLYVGTISPHKNLKRMIKAFYKIKKQGYNYQLVIAGKKGWMYNDIFEFIKQKNLEKEVIFTDYISDEELELLYQNCMFTVFISLYEGFGIPPLESMARNKPVLVSKIASIPEVVGEAGLYCNPFNIEDISKKMVELIDNKNLRQNLISKGNKRIEYFKWEDAAKKTYNLYEKELHNINHKIKN